MGGLAGHAVLGNGLAHVALDASLEFLAVAKGEEHLEPDEERSEEDGLEEAVQQGGGAVLELAVADKLEDPADDVGGDGVGGEGVGVVVGKGVVAGGGGGEAEEGEGGAGDGLEQDVEAAPEQRAQRAEVELQVGDGEAGRQRDERRGVCGLGEVGGGRSIGQVFPSKGGGGGGEEGGRGRGASIPSRSRCRGEWAHKPCGCPG